MISHNLQFSLYIIFRRMVFVLCLHFIDLYEI